MNKQLVRMGMIFICPAAIFLLLLLPGIICEQNFSFDALKRLLLCLLFLLLPAALFYRNIKLYFYLLVPWIFFTPLFIYAWALFKIKPTFELIFLLLQSNAREAMEISKGYVSGFIVITVLYAVAYVVLVKVMPVKRVSFKAGMLLTIFSTSIILAQCYRYLYAQQQHPSDFLSRYYPVSILSGIADAYIILKKNNLKEAEGFSFHAYKKDTLAGRQIYVFIIGETSRYDRWQVNEYHQPTSPRLQQRSGLLTFTDMISGSNLTWLSVPQMITRAHPGNMDLQFKEKSVLSAFKEAGFKTVWLSTQNDQQVIWQGSIALHAKTADVVRFTRTYSPTFELEDIYDEVLLPQLDSILQTDTSNLFVVLHTMGNHWDYSRRYPPAFKVFESAYDNSIRYADFIIDSVISLVEKQQAISQVTFLSDHGEELNQAYHTNPCEATLHVPFFIWTSEQYRQQYPQKVECLLQNRDKKNGVQSVFYTLLDMANIGFPEMDFAKSIAHNGFSPGGRYYYDAAKRRGCKYEDLLHVNRRGK